MKPRIAILNGRFDPLTIDEAVGAVFAAINQRERGWLCTVNVATLMTMRGNQRLQEFVDHARWVVADGQPLVWCSRLFGTALPERVAGIDLLDALCRRAAEEKKGVYLLGTTAHLLERTRANLRRRHPGLEVDGSSGYFDRDQWPARADAIRASGASLLCVGMGTPRQEFFIAEQWDRLGAAVAMDTAIVIPPCCIRPVDLRVRIARILSIPPRAAMFLATSSSAVCARQQAATAAANETVDMGRIAVVPQS